MKTIGAFLTVALICVAAITEVRAEPVQPVDRWDTPMYNLTVAQLAQVQSAADVQLAQASAPSLPGHWGRGCGSTAKRLGEGTQAVTTLGQGALGVMNLGGYDGGYLAPALGAGLVGPGIMGIAMGEIFSEHCGLASRAFRALARKVGVCTYVAFGEQHESLGRVGWGNGSCVKVG